MNDLLANPAVQAGLAPFVVALVLSVLLLRTRLMGLAIAAGFATVIVLAIGFSFEPLTAVRKMVLCGVAACVVLLLLELCEVAPRTAVRLPLVLASGLAAVWVVLRVLQQQDTGRALLAASGAVAYVALLVDGSTRASDDPIALAASSLMMGLCAGALGLLGASASIAQLGIGIGAASGATLLVQMVSGKRASLGWTLAFPAGLLSGMIGLLAVFTASLPWYCLLPTLLIPWATHFYPAGWKQPIWVTAILMALFAFIPVLAAVATAWFTASASSA